MDVLGAFQALLQVSTAASSARPPPAAATRSQLVSYPMSSSVPFTLVGALLPDAILQGPK
jgi:hypothetical protein